MAVQQRVVSDGGRGNGIVGLGYYLDGRSELIRVVLRFVLSPI